MFHDQTRSEGGSNGSSHHRGGHKGDSKGDRKGSKGVNKLSGSGTATSATSPREQNYEPRNDAHYVRVARRLPNDYSHLESVVNHPALNTGLSPLYGAPHASLRGGDATRYSLGDSLNAPQASQIQPAYAGHSSYAQQTQHQVPGYDYSEPYNAVGYVRCDGQVHDNDEVYEEYRQNEQAGEPDMSRSESWFVL